MLTTIEQFAGKDIWVYAELEYEDAYIRVEKVFDNGTVWYNAWLPSDSYDKYGLDEILYGELTGDVDSIEIHPLDTLTTEELIAKIKADGKISGCSKVTSSRKFTKYPANYVKASSGTKYPVVTLSFEGEDMATGRLDSEEFVQGIVKAMHQNDEFAMAMADFFDPETNNEAWEDTTYEAVATGIVDFCKSDYREWEALKSRGREDGDWVVISEDESIVIS